jgi:hypothetical protein
MGGSIESLFGSCTSVGTGMRLEIWFLAAPTDIDEQDVFTIDCGTIKVFMVFFNYDFKHSINTFRSLFYQSVFPLRSCSKI